ncbi:iron chaperone [soil metagenome]
MPAKPKSSKTASAKPKTLEEYLAPLPVEQRAALEKLRQTIRLAAPTAEEGLSYGVGAFRLRGKYLVGFGAGKKHCAFYLGSTLRDHLEDLQGYDLSTGTIRFQPEKPLPAALVRKLVKARITQNVGYRAGK